MCLSLYDHLHWRCYFWGKAIEIRNRLECLSLGNTFSLTLHLRTMKGVTLGLVLAVIENT